MSTENKAEVITMTDLVLAIQGAMKEDGIDISKAKIKSILNYFLEGVKSATINGDTVKLIGFATFDTPEVSESEKRSPITGEKIIVPTHRRIRARLSSAWKKVVAETR